jgi:type IV secretion system protein VirB10
MARLAQKIAPASDEGSVLGSLSAPPSLVSRRDRPWGLWLGVGGIAILALIVFVSMSQAREVHAMTPVAQALAPVTPAVPFMAASTQPEPPQQPTMPLPPPSAAPVFPGAAPAVDPSTRWKAPAMVVDIGDEGAPAASAAAVAIPQTGSGGASPQGVAAAGPRLSADEQFGERMASTSADTTRATRLRDTALIIPQGTIIPAVMETAINLDLPGFARAVVSRDVRGFDGSAVLIPRGSKLIGQYRAGAAAGQSRAFVVWSRVLTPDGVSIDIGSPASDRLGRSGVEGETNTHFFRRFGSSILLSVLSAGLEASSGRNAPAIIIGSQQQASNIASIALQKDIDIPDTITVAQGAPIRVFVARDLDFSGVAPRPR